MDNVIKIECDGVELGAIVRSTYHNNGIGFFQVTMTVFNLAI